MRGKGLSPSLFVRRPVRVKVRAAFAPDDSLACCVFVLAAVLFCLAYVISLGGVL